MFVIGMLLIILVVLFAPEIGANIGDWLGGRGA